MGSSLYRKYRPQSFSDVVGQAHIVSTLSKALEQARMSHAYLFCGPRGTGKTSMARLLAKALLDGESPSAQPDPESESSRAIASGVHPDVYELDAASRTGVDSIREEIISKVQFAPTHGRFKIYIIDEVHMLSTAAFNALLKTLEEPPTHVVFVLCTTDPQKVPDTIVSRCQRFDFTHFTLDDLLGRLKYVCDQEGFKVEEKALRLLAQHAAGGMRDALSLLEQLAVFGDGQISYEDSLALLGEFDRERLLELARCLAEQDPQGCFSLTAGYAQEASDFTRLTYELVALFRACYLYISLGPQYFLVDKNLTGTKSERLLLLEGYDIAELEDMSKIFSQTDKLTFLLSELAELGTRLPSVQDQRLYFEMACMRIMWPQQQDFSTALVQRIEALEKRLAAVEAQGGQGLQRRKEPQAVQELPLSRTARTAQEPSLTYHEFQSTQTVSQSASAVRAQAERKEDEAVERLFVEGEPYQSEGASSISHLSQEDLDVCWEKFKKLVSEKNPARGVLFSSIQKVYFKDEILYIQICQNSEFVYSKLNEEESKKFAEQYFIEVFGHSIAFKYCMYRSRLEERVRARDKAKNCQEKHPLKRDGFSDKGAEQRTNQQVLLAPQSSSRQAYPSSHEPEECVQDTDDAFQLSSEVRDMLNESFGTAWKIKESL